MNITKENEEERKKEKKTKPIYLSDVNKISKK